MLKSIPFSWQREWNICWVFQTTFGSIGGPTTGSSTKSHHYSAKMTPHHPHMSKGDVVVHDEILPHTLWKLGRIQELLTGWEGLPWGFLVRIATDSIFYWEGNCNVSIHWRFVSRDTEKNHQRCPAPGHDDPLRPSRRKRCPSSRGTQEMPWYAVAKRTIEGRGVWIQELQDWTN